MFNFNDVPHSDCVKILIKMLDVCDTAGIYAVDANQRIIDWNQKMEDMTGIAAKDAMGQTCAKELSINEFSDHQELQISLFKTAENAIAVKKFSQIIHNNRGGFVGGIGLLQINNEQNKQNSNNAPTESRQNFYGIISRAPTMEPVFQLIQNAAATDVTVLVRGESGSGKELVAKAIHDLSTRRAQPFLAINCAALSSNLLESELFGHARGAFTGAIKDHSGLFERARGGTLFLDEVAELPLDLQAKLLRVLQERNFIPVGGNKTIEVDVRIVAATHRSLREEVKLGRFREDLMYRLRVVPIFIPPLRERREDINLLLWHFIRQHNDDEFRRIEKIDPLAMRELMDYPWPGNIRELQNVVEYAFVVGQGADIIITDLPPEFRESKTRDNVISESPVLLPVEEEEAIRQALKQSHGKVNIAAQLLGMSRATFWRKRKFYEIE